MIYLDYNATTPLRHSVKECLVEALDVYGNPSSLHQAGRRARGKINEARDIIASSLGVSAAQLIFTSGGSEANNLAIRGFFPEEGIVFVSAIEHASVKKAAPHARAIPVTAEGIINVEALEQALQHCRKDFLGPILIAVMLANNETGVIQPLQRISELARNLGAYVHCDAVQAFGKIPCVLKDLGADTLAISAHKLGGPKGIGALALSERMKLHPMLQGGGQERGLRAGTENVLGIIGFGVAVNENRLEDWHHLQIWRDTLEENIQALSHEPLIFGRQAPRLPNTSCIRMPAVEAELQLMTFDLEGIAVSAGSACSSGRIEASETLLAMGIKAEQAQQAIRVSMGWDTTTDEIDCFFKNWRQLYERRQTTLAASLQVA